MNCAIQNNKHIIRILQFDILHDLNSWDIKLKDTINYLLLETISTIKYIGIDEKYFK
jgi:hypothetical protein